MSFLEWRKFNFFDIKEGVDKGRLSELFKDCDVVVASSGNNHLVLGDSVGQIYLISRSWDVTCFRGYELRISLIEQLRNSPLLVTIGEDEPGVNPLIKVWDTSRDKNGVPHCCRVSRAIPGNRPVAATVLCVHEGLQLMTVGFSDGSLVLYRGDVMRDRGSKQKLLRDASSTVTGLAFKSTSSAILLFVSTESSVFVYNVTHKDKEQRFNLDTTGCAKRCSVLAESTQESHFMVGKNDAIYCYTSDGRGPCFAVEGEKVLLEWFRSYLIIVSHSIRPNVQSSQTSIPLNSSQTHTLTILDIQNKFIVYSTTLNKIRAILNEWGGLYILDVANNIFHLDEKDLQSKLSLLFKKNLYDVSIRIAKSQQYDAEGLVDIFRQYGDHLYAKGDFWGAIEQYAKTIGRLEPSYVIRKFLDSQHIEKLTSYLQSIHKQGLASEDHTTLLLNCFTKLNKPESLKEFILQKDRDVDFDVEIAIKVCRRASSQEALMLAKKHNRHDWYIKIQIEDHARYKEALEYLTELHFKAASFYMKKYGQILIINAPYESTQFLKRLCTDFNSNKLMQKADPEDFIHLFLNNSENLIEFLEHLISNECILSISVYDTLLEHYLHVWNMVADSAEKNKFEQKILKILQNSDINYDKSQALVVCHMHGFSKGVLYLYEEEKLYQQILRYHMSRGDMNSILACCQRFGHQEPTLWIQALWSCIREGKGPSLDLLPEILTVIAKERLLSPQLVIEAISSGKSEITLSHIRQYILNELTKECQVALSDFELTKKYRKDTDKLKRKLDTLENGVIVIQGSRCAACHHQLELPSIHFLCQHSYHQHCFQSFAENENECVACVPRNKHLLELLKAQEYNKDLHETFHSQLEKVDDGFSLAAEYFGRGVFKKVTVVTDMPFSTDKFAIRKEISETALKWSATKSVTSLEGSQDRQQQKSYEPPQHQQITYEASQQQQNYGPGAEARLRQGENLRSGGTVLLPTAEGRMRLSETHMYGKQYKETVSRKGHKEILEDKGKRDCKNPFDSDYDEKMNPFAEEENVEDDKLQNDDYDKNLNPFAS